jgi:hypothetical protein
MELNVNERGQPTNDAKQHLTIGGVAMWGHRENPNPGRLPNGFQILVWFCVIGCGSAPVQGMVGVPYGLQFTPDTGKNPVYIAQTGFFFRGLLPNCCKMIGVNRTRNTAFASK